MLFHSRMFLMSCTLALSSLPHLSAQSVEVFGGYTLGNIKPQETLNRNTTNGWNTSITGYPRSRFGLTADFAGAYATVNNDGAPSVDARQYTFMAGPQVRLFRKERFETSVRALVGGARREFGTTEQTSVSALFGSNFDVNMSKRVALRFSPGMNLTNFNNEVQRDFRFSVGPVFRFGGGER